MGKYKYLANNIALFSVSNFVSKILVFLLVPFYTSMLTTREYGIANLLQVTMLLLVPSLTLNIGEAALRYAVEFEKQRGSIFLIGLKYTGIASAAVAVIAGTASIFVSGEIKQYLWFFIALFAANALYEFLILFFQGSEMVPIVVCGSVCCTIVMISANLLFLLVMKIGLNGYLMAQILSFLIAAMLMFFLGRSGIHKSSLKESKGVEQEMLTYGKPMILYSVSSWINNASDRYVVLAFCGAAVNGIYGVAYNIPAILTVFQRIFAQAWQLSATKSRTDQDSAEFYSTMYKLYHAFMVLGCSFLIVGSKIIAAFLFKKEFYAAWSLVPPLLISVVFGALTGFLGSICLAHKDSKSMGLATGIGAILNLLLNLLTVQKFGAMGAAVSTAISYYVMYLFAFIFVHKYVKINCRQVRNYVSYLILGLQAFLMIQDINGAFLISILLFLILVLLHFKELVEIGKTILEKVKQKGVN
ncbi:MAG: oligosaccharide flippase family protein [Clostridia bacterium]|nr:oligosaccharide flippase family protein [Clostridia bacterium]